MDSTHASMVVTLVLGSKKNVEKVVDKYLQQANFYS